MNFREAKNVGLFLGAAAIGCCISGSVAAQDAKHKIYLSMSYIGNDWQSESANMVRAMAISPELIDKIDLQVQVSGPNAQKQIQQINSMVQAGADAIVIYPISPSALNSAIKNACNKGVAIFTYDSVVTEPCAHQVHVDQKAWGVESAEWLVGQLGGEGKIVMINGVPGTTTDADRIAGAKSVFSKYPEIKVIAEANGMWSQAVARTELSKIFATNSWDEVDGVWMQVGCFTANSLQLEAGIAETDLRPCAGEASNGGRVQMLPVEAQVDGANGHYRPVGAKRWSAGSGNFTGAYALKLAVQKLEGAEVPQEVIVPNPAVTNKNVQLCEEGTWEEMSKGCNVFKPSIVPNPGWFASIYSDLTPEVGLSAALVGQPE